LYQECRAGAQIIFPESGRGLGHVTPTIFGSMVGYPSDSLASCYILIRIFVLIHYFQFITEITPFMCWCAAEKLRVDLLWNIRPQKCCIDNEIVRWCMDCLTCVGWCQPLLLFTSRLVIPPASGWLYLFIYFVF